MFHCSNNLFFGRYSDGSVRIVQLKPWADQSMPAPWPQVDDNFGDRAVFDVTIDDGSWGSIVCSVSAKGEENGRWYTAMDFHHGREKAEP